MAEFLTQDEIDDLLNFVDLETPNKLEDNFVNYYIQSIKETFKETLLSKSNINVNVINYELFKNNNKNKNKNKFYTKNNFEIYINNFNKNKKYSYSFLIPEDKKHILVKEFLDVSIDIETNEDEVDDGLFELSEHILGSCLTGINANGCFNEYFREQRKKQETISFNELCNYINNDYDYTNLILNLEINNEIIEIIVLINKKMFQENTEKNMKKINNIYEKNYSHYDFKRHNLLDIKKYNSLNLFFSDVAKEIEIYLKENIYDNKNIKAYVYSIEQMSFNDFIYSWPQNTNISILKSKELNAMLITEINPLINKKIVTSLLGISDVESKKYLEDIDEDFEVIGKNIFTSEIYKKYNNEIIEKSLNKCLNNYFDNIDFKNIRNINDTNCLNELYASQENVIDIIMEISINNCSGFLSFNFNINEIMNLLNVLSTIYYPIVKKEKHFYIKNDKIDVKLLTKLNLKNKNVIEGYELNLNENLFYNEIININNLFIDNKNNQKEITNNVELYLGRNNIYDKLDDMEVIKLNQKINEPFDVYIGKTKICDAEVIIHNNNFGFKVTNKIEDFDNVIDNIEQEYFVLEINDKKFLTLDNVIIYEINDKNILINIL